MTPANILLIDDHAIFRFGLSMALNNCIKDAKVFEANSIGSAILCTANNLDLILLDIQLPGLSGLAGIAILKDKYLKTPIWIISSQDDSESIKLANACGAAGFISKIEPVENVVEKIQLILSGEHPEPTLASKSSALKRLTPRQCEVLNLLYQGLPDKVIAHQLSLSESTVHLHVRNLLAFFNAKSRTEVVFAAREQRILDSR